MTSDRPVNAIREEGRHGARERPRVDAGADHEIAGEKGERQDPQRGPRGERISVAESAPPAKYGGDRVEPALPRGRRRLTRADRAEDPLLERRGGLFHVQAAQG